MIQVTINYLAILAVAVEVMVIGMVWYSRAVFGKKWTHLMGIKCDTKEDLKEMQKKAMPAMMASLVGSLVMAYVLVHFIQYAGAKTAMQGALTGFWLWLGFVAPVQLTDVMFGRKKLLLWYINTGYQLVTLLIAGAILAAWV